MINASAAAHLTYPVSPDQVRELMCTIPSWVRILPEMHDDTAFQDSEMDSLAFLELVEELQNASGLTIPDDDVARISTIAGSVQYLNERLR
jgi:acyl carrier protein